MRCVIEGCDQDTPEPMPKCRGCGRNIHHLCHAKFAQREGGPYYCSIVGEHCEKQAQAQQRLLASGPSQDAGGVRAATVSSGATNASGTPPPPPPRRQAGGQSHHSMANTSTGCAAGRNCKGPSNVPPTARNTCCGMLAHLQCLATAMCSHCAKPANYDGRADNRDHHAVGLPAGQGGVGHPGQGGGVVVLTGIAPPRHVQGVSDGASSVVNSAQQIPSNDAAATGTIAQSYAPTQGGQAGATHDASMSHQFGNTHAPVPVQTEAVQRYPPTEGQQQAASMSGDVTVDKVVQGGPPQPAGLPVITTGGAGVLPAREVSGVAATPSDGHVSTTPSAAGSSSVPAHNRNTPTPRRSARVRTAPAPKLDAPPSTAAPPPAPGSPPKVQVDEVHLDKHIGQCVAQAFSKNMTAANLATPMENAFKQKTWDSTITAWSKSNLGGATKNWAGKFKTDVKELVVGQVAASLKTPMDDGVKYLKEAHTILGKTTSAEVAATASLTKATAEAIAALEKAAKAGSEGSGVTGQSRETTSGGGGVPENLVQDIRAAVAAVQQEARKDVREGLRADLQCLVRNPQTGEQGTFVKEVAAIVTSAVVRDVARAVGMSLKAELPGLVADAVTSAIGPLQRELSSRRSAVSPPGHRLVETSSYGSGAQKRAVSSMFPAPTHTPDSVKRARARIAATPDSLRRARERVDRVGLSDRSNHQDTAMRLGMHNPGHGTSHGVPSSHYHGPTHGPSSDQHHYTPSTSRGAYGHHGGVQWGSSSDPQSRKHY
ncbi:unnamed protein product [Ectocarpus fasciculatus]